MKLSNDEIGLLRALLRERAQSAAAQKNEQHHADELSRRLARRHVLNQANLPQLVILDGRLVTVDVQRTDEGLRVHVTEGGPVQLMDLGSE